MSTMISLFATPRLGSTETTTPPSESRRVRPLFAVLWWQTLVMLASEVAAWLRSNTRRRGLPAPSSLCSCRSTCSSVGNDAFPHISLP